MKSLSSPALLRTAAVLSLLYCLGHMSGFPWTPGLGAEPEAVVAQMKSVHFETMGEQRAYWDFYFGFGLITGAALLTQAFCLWFLAGVARRDAGLSVPVAACFMLGSLLNAALCQLYFFSVPMIFALLIALLLAASIVAARRTPG